MTWVVNSNGCWIWQGKVDADGYGYWSRKKRAHIALWEKINGPTSFLLHHQCENKLCVNPDHLVLTDEATHNRLHHVGRTKSKYA